MKVAFVHDWLVTYRGGEKVLESLLELYPEAPVYTLFYAPNKMPEAIRKRKIIYPKWLAPFSRARKLLLPLLPKVIESFNLNEFDLVISSSSCVAKGVITKPDAMHLCYVHSPMRYIWDQRFEYQKPWQKIPGVVFLLNFMSSYLRVWDYASTQRVDKLVANSGFVAQRLKKYFGREADVVFPPVATPRHPEAKPKDLPDSGTPYFLCAGAMVTYKRLDIAIQACRQLKLNLVIAGSGPLLGALRKQAAGHTSIRFVESPSDGEWSNLLANAQALLFPGIEDFGMTPIEAMSLGTPVIAYKGGGALDFMNAGLNGEFFLQQNPESLTQVLQNFSRTKYDPQKIKASVHKFNKSVFQDSIRRQVNQMLEGKTQ